MTRLPHRYIAQRLAEGDKGTAPEKGAALEDVIAKTFCKVPGVGFIWRNKSNCAGSDEIDMLLYNWRDRLGLPFLPEYLLFECKNWAKPVNSSTLVTFVEKIRVRRLEVGILVAARGITGNGSELRAAKDIIRSAFERDNITVLVITRAELEALRTVKDLVALIQEKFGEFRGRGFILISDSNESMKSAHARRSPKKANRAAKRARRQRPAP